MFNLKFALYELKLVRKYRATLCSMLYARKYIALVSPFKSSPSKLDPMSTCNERSGEKQMEENDLFGEE